MVTVSVTYLMVTEISHLAILNDNQPPLKDNEYGMTHSNYRSLSKIENSSDGELHEIYKKKASTVIYIYGLQKNLLVGGTSRLGQWSNSRDYQHFSRVI